MLELATQAKTVHQIKDILGGEIPKGLTNAELITAVQLSKAIDGNLASYQELMDSGYGKNEYKVNNLHSFNKMDSVKAEISGSGEEMPLSFDIGQEPLHDKEGEE